MSEWRWPSVKLPSSVEFTCDAAHVSECSGSLSHETIPWKIRPRAKDVVRGREPGGETLSQLSVVLCEKHKCDNLNAVGFDEWDALDNVSNF